MAMHNCAEWIALIWQFITARSELRKVLLLALPVTFLCMKYLGDR